MLVAYYSETGNTEKIAKAIYGEASREHEAHLTRVKDISAETLNDYDLVFLGSACHSSDLAAPVKKLLKELPESPKFKLAGFFTPQFGLLNKTNKGRLFSTNGRPNA